MCLDAYISICETNKHTYLQTCIHIQTHTHTHRDIHIFIHINLCIWRAIHTCRFVSLGILMHMHHTCPAANPYTCLAEGSGRLCYYTELSHNLPDQLVGLSIICGKYHSMHARSYAYTCTHTHTETDIPTYRHTYQEEFTRFGRSFMWPRNVFISGLLRCKLLFWGNSIQAPQFDVSVSLSMCSKQEQVYAFLYIAPDLLLYFALDLSPSLGLHIT